MGWRKCCTILGGPLALTVSYEHPDFPEGMEFEIVGLGLIPNGGSVELTDEQEERYLNYHGMTVKESLENDPYIKVKGSARLKPSAIEEVKVSDTNEELGRGEVTD